ncbi:MAG: pantetheine-phosphate adenylyltransferase [Lachnospira sp.]|nr:pantetheine-phosphate adenylyltransferase [Lachnospira sp.]
MKIAIYPGSFDPVTLGHLDIIERAAKMVDKLIIGVLNNNTKNPLFSADDRVNMLKEVTSHLDNVEVEAFSGLLIDFVKRKNADVVIRGLRAITDFEYELQMAQTNRTMEPTFDTIFLITSLQYAYLSSSTVKEVAKFGGDLNKFLPQQVIPKVKDKYNIK